MKNHLNLRIPRLALALALVAAATPLVRAAGPEAGSLAEMTKHTDWRFTPDPALPNVLILGDSISIGYTLQVRELLKGKANVFRPMRAGGKLPMNCSGTTDGINGLDAWLAGQEWAVIHFNWGLHDLKHVRTAGSSQNSNKPGDPVQATVETYGRNLEAITTKLKATGARLVFATTTPVVAGTVNPLREADAPTRYNAAALKIMEANQIRVNDLFTFCEPSLGKWQLPRNVHFKPEGSVAMAAQVAAVISEELEASGKPRQVSE